MDEQRRNGMYVDRVVRPALLIATVVVLFGNLALGTEYRGMELLPFVKGAGFHAQGESGLRLYRLDPAQKSDYGKNEWARSLEYAGCRLEFQTQAASLTLQYAGLGQSPYKGFVRRKFMVYRNGRLLGETRIGDKAAGEVIIPLAQDGRTDSYIVYLPFMMYFELVSLQTSGKTILLPINNHRPRVVFYGDSITQGCQATSPDKGYPEMVARKLDLDLYNLGLAGAGKGSKSIGLTIAKMKPDAVVIAYGTNLIYGKWTRTTYQERHADFIKALRSQNPRLPLLVASPIFRPGVDDTPKAQGCLSQGQMRQIQHDLIKNMMNTGDENLYLLDGLSLIGRSETALLRDKVHPRDAGYAQMAERIANKLNPILQPKD
jgi:lysophospholipase L1-like esterase